MGSVTIDATADIPKLRDFVDRVLALADRPLRSLIRYDHEDDHLGFMLLTYVSKQCEHLQSIRVLVDAGRDRDALLIVRTMVEGHALLFWAAREPERLPLLWKAFAFVADWRTMRETQANG